MKSGYVYIISNQKNGTIYIGVTSDLINRIYQHRLKSVEGFSKRYSLTDLVWYEIHETIESAIITEKKLKNLHRNKKISIIESLNPQWVDLYPSLTGSCATASQSAG
jgi:putative endonuclease